MRHSVARRSLIRSWCGEKVSYGRVSQSGNRQQRKPGREERHLVDQALRVLGVGRDDGRELALGLGPCGHARQQQRIG